MALKKRVKKEEEVKKEDKKVKVKKEAEEAPKEPARLCPFCFSEIHKDATRCPHCTSELPVETKH